MNVMCWVEMLSCGTSLSPKIKYTIDQQTAGWIGQTIANKTSDQTVTKSSAETDRNTRVCFSFSLNFSPPSPWLLIATASDNTPIRCLRCLASIRWHCRTRRGKTLPPNHSELFMLCISLANRIVGDDAKCVVA